MVFSDADKKPSWYQKNLDKGRAYANAKRKKTDWRVLVWRNAKQRVRRANIEFTINIQDIPTPGEFCPVLKIPLFLGEGRPCDNSPSIDRIDNTKGYVPGNVRIISYRANSLRSNATKLEIEKILLDLKKIQDAIR